MVTTRGTDDFDFDAFNGLQLKCLNILSFSILTSVIFYLKPMPLFFPENLKRTLERNGNLLLFKSVNPIMYIFTVSISLDIFRKFVLKIQAGIHAKSDFLKYVYV